MINKRYIVLRKIGEGRSLVFLCHDKNFNRDVAVKFLPPAADKNEIFSFREEYLLLKRINHPNILSVYEYGTVLKLDNNGKIQNELAGSKYITSEFIQGDNLSDHCEKTNCAFIDTILAQISNTLYFLHQSNLIYFDLKPENILVHSDNGTPRVKFIDFGFVQNMRKMG